jgi:hypothetical protein
MGGAVSYFQLWWFHIPFYLVNLALYEVYRRLVFGNPGYLDTCQPLELSNMKTNTNFARYCSTCLVGFVFDTVRFTDLILMLLQFDCSTYRFIVLIDRNIVLIVESVFCEWIIIALLLGIVWEL